MFINYVSVQDFIKTIFKYTKPKNMLSDGTKDKFNIVTFVPSDPDIYKIEECN